MKDSPKRPEPDGWRAKACIEIQFKTSRLAHTAALALRPELDDSPSDRTTADLAFNGGSKMYLTIEAKDTSALRAALNSYLRWVSAIVRAVSALEASRDRDSLPGSRRTKRN